MQAVIFDWDLTLWNSWGIHLGLMENTAAELGKVPPTAEAVAAEFHRPFHQHLLWFFGSHPDAENELEGILPVYLSHYHAIDGHRRYLYPGVATLLNAFRRRGLRVGILSDKIPYFGEIELRESGLAPLVEYANFKTDSRPYKPAPDGLLDVLENMAVDPNDAMYVGDGPQDIACARSVGATSVAALWATIDQDAILAEQPTHRVYRPHQVMAVVAEANGYGGADPWRRHLPWPWRPDADNPEDDQDAGNANLADAGGVGLSPLLSWPLADRWRGRTRDLALPPRDANPIAPLRLQTSVDDDE